MHLNKQGTRTLSLLFVIMVAALTVYHSMNRAKNVGFERDEISWYFHTKFFDEAFIKKQLFSPIWTSYEGFDHPQISKYIYGAYLYLLDHRYAVIRTGLEQKYDRWDFYLRIPSNDVIQATEFAPIIRQLRKVNILFAIGILAELFLLLFIFTRSVIFSICFTMIFSYNPLFNYATTIVTSDNHSIFFGLLGILCYMRSLSSKSSLWIIASSIMTSLSVGAKLTGSMIFFSVIAHETIRILFAKSEKRHAIKRVGLYGIVSFVTWIVINPTLYLRPLDGTWEYFSFRYFQSANIAYHLPNTAMTSMSEKLIALLCNMFVIQCKSRIYYTSFVYYGMPQLIALLFSIVYIIKTSFTQKTGILYWIIFMYLLAIFYLMLIANYSERYYLFIQITVYVIQTYGIYALFLFVFRKLRTTRTKM